MGSREAGHSTGEQQAAQLHLKSAACCQQTGALGQALAHCTAALSMHVVVGSQVSGVHITMVDLDLLLHAEMHVAAYPP